MITDKVWLENLVKFDLGKEMNEKTLYKLDVLNRNTNSKTEENAELQAQIMELDIELYASNVKDALGVTVQKASYLLQALEKEGKLTSENALIEGKKSAVKLYSRV